MNKMRTIVLVLVVLFLLTGCGGNIQKTSEKSETITVIDLSATYPEVDKGVDCELKYIPLETNDKVLIAGHNDLSYVSDDKIVITNTNLGNIFVFDGKGKILSYFNHKGQGPEEYKNARKIVYDSTHKEIFVFEYNSAVVYSEQGEYKRRLNYGNSITFSRSIFNFDNESFLAHIEDSKRVDSSFAFISKNEGKILSFVNLLVEKTIATTVIYKNQNIIKTVRTQQLFKDGDGFILSPLSMDTIYHLTKEKQLIPLLIRTPSVLDSDPPSVLMPMIVTDKFLLLIQSVINLDANAKYGTEQKQFWYDRVEHRFYRDFNWDCPVINSIIASLDLDMQRNWYISLVDVYKIKEYVEDNNGEVDDKLKEIAEALDDDDNPVLEITKFK
jgi:hypothetical protein